MSRWRYALAGVVAMSCAVADARQPIAALAPVELVLALPGTPTGVAVAPDGTLFVSDSTTGILHLVDPSGRHREIADGFDAPYGIALDPEGRLLIVERGRGRILRREPSGALRVFAEGLTRPEWMAVSPDGVVFVTDDSRDLLRIDANGVDWMAAGLDHAGGLATAPAGLYVLTKHQVLLYADRDTQPTAWEGLKHGGGAAVDVFASLYWTAKEIDWPTGKAKDGIGKLRADSGLTVFAEQLREPRGLAVGPDGSLYVADAGAGHVLRFRAPVPPRLDPLPAYTNRSFLPVSGVADPDSAIVIETPLGAVAGATDAAGAFRLQAPLEADADNVLHVFATPHLGAGLTGAPAEARIRQDSRPPVVRFSSPPAAGIVRSAVTVRVDAADDASGIDRLTLSRDSSPLGVSTGAIEVQWDTRTGGDGWHALSAVAIDRAGNRGEASRAVLVDNTPPDTTLVEPPPAEVLSKSAEFRFAGADNLTPAQSLRFAWRLDGGAFGSPSEATTATVRDLTPGDHLFEVRAVDLAGNEDPTPASVRFTVRTGPAIAITTPGNGAVVDAGFLLVRGTVDARGLDIGIVVNGVAATVDGAAFVALVPVFVDTTAVTAVATSAGGSAMQSVEIMVRASAGVPGLSARPSSGLAPLTVTFGLGGAADISRIELDADGDGRIDVVTSDESVSFTYTAPGVYLPTVRAVDTSGVSVSATAVVQVLDQVAFEDARRVAWASLRDALVRGDVNAALGVFVPAARPRYQAAFQLLAGGLPQIAADMADLALVSAGGGIAELATTRVQSGFTRLYLVYFIQDEDGLWRILTM